MKKWIQYNFVALVAIVMIGCGGSEDSNGGGAGGKVDHYPGALFTDVDENKLINDKSKNHIKTGSSGATVELKSIDDKIEVSAADVLSDNADNGSMIFNASLGTSHFEAEKPLFVGDKFKGIVKTAAIEGGGIKVILGNAESIEEVYDTFDMEMQNDAIIQSIQRSINTQAIQGKYDAYNSKPLAFSIAKRSDPLTRGLNNEELVLRIDIPQGYRIPIEPRSLSCSFSSVECSFTTTSDTGFKIDLAKTYSTSGVTFTTEGSYVEIGLGTYIKAHFDKNFISDSTFDFTLAQSGYFKSSMKVKISGELSKNWSTDLKLINDFDIEIVHPYSAIVKTSVSVAPVITLGASGKISGSVTASSYVERTGEVRFSYDSATQKQEAKTTLKYTPTNMNKDGIDVEAKAEVDAYIFPNLLMVPNIKLLRINLPLTMVYFRSGVKLNTNITGSISKGFVVENGTQQSTTAAEASVTTTLFGLVQSKWMVRAGGIDFYHTDDYSDLFKTGSLEVLEWKSALLKTPKVIVTQDPNNPNTKKITFDADEKSTLKSKLYFYYTIADTNEARYDIPVKNISSHSPVWHAGDAPITISKDSTVKVRSVLYNSDVSKSIWAWGTSVSEQATIAIVNIMKPTISPQSQSFEGSLNISMRQSQGYDIYYKLNGGSSTLYSSTLNLTESATITAYASTTVNGAKTLSEIVSATYTKCTESQSLINGICTANGEGDGDGDGNGDGDGGVSGPHTCPISYDASAGVLLYSSENGYLQQIGTTSCSYYPSGKIQGEAPSSDGKLNGTSTSYYESGVLNSEIQYVNNLYHGYMKFYTEDGTMVKCLTFNHGTKTGDCMP